MPDRPRTVFTDDHEIFRRSVRRFVDAELASQHEAWEEAGVVPREAWRKAGEAGLLCCDVPADDGGPGADFGHRAVVAEELARANLSGPGFVVHSDMVATYLARFGTEEQKRRWLPGTCDGTLIGAIAMTEPDAGSDLKGIRTRAERDGDHYVLAGQIDLHLQRPERRRRHRRRQDRPRGGCGPGRMLASRASPAAPRR